MKKISVAVERGQTVIVPGVFTPGESNYTITFREPVPMVELVDHSEDL